MRLVRWGLLLAALLIPPAETQAQARPPAQKTGPITIFGDGSTGPGGGFTAKSAGELLPRAIVDRLRDNGISVKGYGANGYVVGSGGDDSAAINAALQDGCAFTQNNPAGKTCRIIFPDPPSGAYNVCAASVTLPGYWASVSLEGTGASPTIRIKPDCPNPPEQVLYQAKNVGDSSKARVHIDNLTFDGMGLSKYVARFDYAVGLTSKRSIYRNAATDGYNIYIGGGYEISFDNTNRAENVNDPGRVNYPTRAALPKYNLLTYSSDSWYGLAAINAKMANYLNGGPNNHYRDAHGWGHTSAVAPYTTGNFAPLYTFMTYGNADLSNTVADSPQACGYVFRGSQQAQFTGTIGGGVLTVSNVTYGALLPGYAITGEGVPPGVTVVSFGSGTGGAGTYNVSNSLVSAGATAMGAGIQSGAYLNSSMIQGPADFNVTGNISGDVLTPTSIPNDRVIGVGQTVTYGSASATIIADLGGGSYRMSNSIPNASGVTVNLKSCGVLLDPGLQQAIIRNNDMFIVSKMIAPMDNTVHPSVNYGDNNDFYTQWADNPMHAHPPGGDTLTGTAGAAPGSGSTLASTSVTGNSSLYLSAQGAGAVQLNSNYALALSAYANAGAVNALGVTAATAGAPPVMQAIGSDAQISMSLLGKGGGGVLTGYAELGRDPGGSDIPQGQCVDWRNTAAGTYRRWCNFPVGGLRYISYSNQ